METNFDRVLAFTLREEGGNVDDPHDHGGRTSRGVTQRVYDAYRKGRGQAAQDVYRATSAEVRDIYRAQYWNPWCGKLPAGVDLMFFDIAVNAGPGQAVKLLQKALSVEADGAMGMHTLGAVEATDPVALIGAYAERRRAFYRALRQFPRYGKNWMARTGRAERAALLLATEPAPLPAARPIDAPAPYPPGDDTAPAEPHNPAAIAKPTDVATPPMSPEAGVAVTAGAATAAEVCGKAAEQLQPFAATFTTVQYALLALTVLGLALTAYGIVHARRTKAAVG